MHDDLPHRAALVGPPGRVRCDVPGDVLAAVRDGLNGWDTTLDPTPVPLAEIERARQHALAACAAPERPDGGMTNCSPSGAIQEFLSRGGRS